MRHRLRLKQNSDLSGRAGPIVAWPALPRRPPPATGSPDATQGTSSTAVRKSAVQSIPFDKLDADSREKVNSVLSNVSIYRRLPVRMVNCDPDLYLFLVRHPDIVVNIWEILGVSQLQLRQIEIDTFRIVEAEGTAATLEYVYHSQRHANRLRQVDLYGPASGPQDYRHLPGHFENRLQQGFRRQVLHHLAAGRFFER